MSFKIFRRQHNNYTYFFITGFQRSGTTWVAKLVGSHPAIYCNYEGYFFSTHRNVVNLATIILDSEALTAWGKRTFNGWSENIDEEKIEILRMIIQYYFKKRTSKFIIGDKTPTNDIATLHSIMPDAKAINVVRDGRDVLASMANYQMKEIETHFKKEEISLIRGKINEGKTKGEILLDDQVIRIAQSWNTEVLSNIECGKRLYKSNYTIVKYEDLLTNPKKTIKGVFALLNAYYSDKIVQSCIKKSRFEKLSRGRKMGNESKSSFFRKGVIGDWVNYLDERQNTLFLTYAQTAMKDLGYHV